MRKLCVIVHRGWSRRKGQYYKMWWYWSLWEKSSYEHVCNGYQVRAVWI